MSRRPSLNRAALAAAGFFLLLTGCGIKSNLEQPQARLAEPEGAAKTTAQETSKVQTGRMFNLLPPEEPAEWDKDKPKKNATSSGKAGIKSTVPDKPFILDSLL